MGRIAGLSAVVAVLVGVVAGAVVYAGKATVTVRLPVRPVSVETTVDGSRDSGYFPTRPVTVMVSDTMRSTASSATVGTYATGEVVFLWLSRCGGSCPTLRVPSGFQVQTDSGIVYRTLREVLFNGSSASPPVRVRAEVAGPSGNVPAHAITRTRVAPGYMAVDNGKPISGGTSRQTHVVLQSDFDSVLTALVGRLQSEVQSAMVLNAGDLVFEEDTSPRYTYTSDHAVGDETPLFTVTMTATLNANGFSDRQARALIAGALRSHVGPVQVSYTIERLSDDGDVRLHGTATGFTVPTPDPQPWQRRLASLRVDQARAELLRAFPGAQVDIRTWGAPWLPAAPTRIAVVFEPLPSYPA
ncbi:MAG TPA: baseplate J/gp47 family protein [Candidatus Dormibacteraeota bacterium]|nr:baseplate J/gp47 family protein [Candidatus Dormibacteraeota bacterium]